MSLLPLLLACSEYGFTEALWTDTFQQDRANEVDLLVVIDNSCSMVEEQDNLARNFDALIGQFVAADVDWRIGVTTTDVQDARHRGRLQGGDDELVLRGPSGEIDRVAWDRDWGFVDGESLQLSADRRQRSDNDARSDWCRALQTYGDDGERGSPGRGNRDCRSGDVLEVGFTSPDEGPRAPTAADLVITELHPQSLGDDRDCEWFELASNTPDTLQLDGVTVSDRGRDHAVLPPYLLAPGDHVVVGRAQDACGAPVDIVLPEGLSLNDAFVYLDATREDAADLFAEAVSAGTTGTGIEAGLEAARLALTEPTLSDENAGWLRPDARLALLFVSDEDDYSPDAVDTYLDDFLGTKGIAGYRDPSRVTVSAVVGDRRPLQEGAPACISDDGVGFHGARYLAAANRTGGLVASICADDFAPIVSDLGLTLSGVSTTFALSRPPVEDTIEVELYDEPTPDGLIRVLVRDDDYTWDPDANAIVFTDAQAPPSSTWLTVRYAVRAGPP
jgi:hypothetical protein